MMIKAVLRQVFKKKALKIRVEGPLDVKLELKILRQLQQSRGKVDGVLVIINSYGGSLSVAKNIASSLFAMKAKQIPVYCFAEEYCLNSANLVLTAGTLCFANKLSVIGDIGFAYQSYLLNGKISLQTVSSGERALDLLADSYQLTHEKDIKGVLAENLKELKHRVLEDREQQIRKQQGIQKFDKEMSGCISPGEAQEVGLIDGVCSCNGFVRKQLPAWKILEGKEGYQYRAINFIRSGLQVFKQE